ncbi:Uncharacterised protein [Streptococcus dysgalactiae subsp. equisimilis]|uniref:Uncharacterized protein n=1 Tax=Streptococcus dysgalactiae subsp. equisimilis TaxID=119602 RepID=A0AAE9R0J9_STREQ|nr:hypothetical protein Javan91_0021 [Streptococcus phage Javan91]SQB82542.1 Uncharacterised protein [Streptococcus dysgalactiae]VTT17732.1 Uncharacterised protein [Streptococcus dysgalactiae]VTT27472.1 Uncharacterised protein [Streptococcus dysgalactiae subsp. equisimilis]
MCWVVRIPVRGRGDTIKYEKHEFKTKKEAERFRGKLGKNSEIYKVSYLRY